MNDLHRELAPISEAAWEAIEKEAKRTLTSCLAARRVIELSGPHGWPKGAISLGRIKELRSPGGGVQGRLRQVQPLVELRMPFELDRAELEAIGAGASDPDLDPLIDSASAIAAAEDRAVFYGYAEAGIAGLCPVAPGGPLTLTDEYERYPHVVAQALSRLRTEAIGGPYAIVLGPRCYTGLTETTVGGYPVIQHVQRLLDGPLVWGPAVDGAIVLSVRGGDFELIVGQDFSIGYLGHTEDKVRLYIQETVTFRTLTPEAAVPLVYAKTAGARKGRG